MAVETKSADSRKREKELHAIPVNDVGEFTCAAQLIYWKWAPYFHDFRIATHMLSLRCMTLKQVPLHFRVSCANQRFTETRTNFHNGQRDEASPGMANWSSNETTSESRIRWVRRFKTEEEQKISSGGRRKKCIGYVFQKAFGEYSSRGEMGDLQTSRPIPNSDITMPYSSRKDR